MIGRFALAGLALAAVMSSAQAVETARSQDMDAMIAAHAKANGIPEELVRRIIVRESRYNARAVGRGGALGLMQIKHPTARGLGYSGPASGLLDANTNLTYGVRYLAGAYRVANGDFNRAVSYFARGYYYEAKRKGLASKLAQSAPVAAVAQAVAPVVETTGSIAKAAVSPLRFVAAEPVERESRN